MNFLRVVDIMESWSMIALFPKRNSGPPVSRSAFIIDATASRAMKSSTWEISRVD